MTRKKQKDKIVELLEITSADTIKKTRKIVDERFEYEWKFFAELEFQRNKIQNEIIKSLQSSSIKDYEFSKWQRAVRWQYSLNPLSTSGSIQYIGGRFNYGMEISKTLKSFPSLYIGEDKETVLRETLGNSDDTRLNSQELALTNPQSESIISVSGKLDHIFDLRDSDRLKSFMALTRNFKISSEILKLAKKLQFDTPTIINSREVLRNTLLAPNWRFQPTQLDIPSNSQIFGNLIYTSGIDGILYPSKLNSKLCLAIFPNNFKNGNSFLELDDEPPLKNIIRKFDSDNYYHLLPEYESLN